MGFRQVKLLRTTLINSSYQLGLKATMINSYRLVKFISPAIKYNIKLSHCRRKVRNRPRYLRIPSPGSHQCL